MDLEGGLLLITAIVRATDFGDRPLIGIVRTIDLEDGLLICLLYTSPSPRD